MKHDTKVHVQPQSNKKHQGHQHPIQSKETATNDLANLTKTESQQLQQDDVVRLSGMVGNREVARLMAQRQEDEEDEEAEVQRSRRQEEEEDEETFEGPRTKLLREDTVQQRGGAGLRSSPGQRALRVDGLASVGDATNVDGQGLYGWNRPMSAADVRSLVTNLVSSQSSAISGNTIFIFSGTHGTRRGNLVNTGAAGFVGEDQATANSVMGNPTTPAGTQIEVIDVPGTYTTKPPLTSMFGMTNYIRILAWCYSTRSYNNSANIKSNWWKAPDHI